MEWRPVSPDFKKSLLADINVRFSSAKAELLHQILILIVYSIYSKLDIVPAGSGLHTFLLFLGPHIIHVAITASVCDSTDFSAQISKYFSWRPEYTHDAWDCARSGRARRVLVQAYDVLS